MATLVRILADKGFLVQTNDDRPFRYRPARSYEDVSRRLLGDLIDRVFRGSREQLLVRLMEQEALTAEERARLADDPPGGRAMNDFGLIVLGVAARVTVLAAVGLALAAVLPAAGAVGRRAGQLATLAVLVGVSAPGASALAPVVVDRGPGRAARPPTAARRPAEVAEAAARPRRPGPDAARRGRAEARSSLARLRPRVRPRAGPAAGAGRARPGWRWPAWVAGGFLAGLVGRPGPPGAGVWAGPAASGAEPAGRRPGPARRWSTRSGPRWGCAGRSRSGVGRGRDARDDRLATAGDPAPAAAGASWDDRERRAVLAHELAHIRRDDYLAGLAAQVSLALHFYHPLVHALAGRLRLEQELAADAWGARLSGGRAPT